MTAPETLKPGQQELLAALFTTTGESGMHRAQHVLHEQLLRLASHRLGHRPDQKPGFEAGLEHARTWANQHGHLAIHRDTLQDGFPLGWRLAGQRQSARSRERRGLPPSPHLAELAAIDPWWNPPWNTEWQRNYHRALTHPHLRITQRWLARQHRTWPLLHPDQQRLLARNGVTPDA
ncbi:helicase associated domain-containing protein [Streptomyces sp. NPDC127051]|uniref:helicase associated domain-containing protein n=1 Tax=Streptomyces sp. NPDC127051 TaxID=3347119 RepID=UPI0036626251